MMKKKSFRIFSLIFVFCILFICVFLAVVYQQVSSDASTRIKRGVIERVIFSESPVYYDDGKTPIGVFFEKTHRQYIHYRDIPKAFSKALISAEDKDFFNHSGFDIKAILRAFIANFRAGRVVQGGSTITQQTAKNIFKRQKRSYMSKLRELFQALLLEKNYKKEEILEMYSNQFFVTGFGRGLRIAAQYFFDKEAEELDLVESAFIAGSVKGPNRYNPFTKKTATDKITAKNLAKQRKDYVLNSMLSMNFITPAQYRAAKEREVPFKEGKVTYGLNVILDYIREQLESDYFRAILEEQGIDNIATSGIQIFTTINSEIQDTALRSLRKNLPLLNVKIAGFEVDSLQTKYQQLAGLNLRKPKTHVPFLCRITDINPDPAEPYLIVAWDQGGGIIDYDGLQPIGESWLKWKLGEWASFDRGHIKSFLKLFRVGDLVPVKFLDGQTPGGQTRLALSFIPDLEGGIVVLHKGMIKAMVGGFFNHFFNRAADAKRQLGSIFKPIVYTAALQLKWNSLDELINMRDLFRFENTFYLPQPDHEPKSDKVSMIWAGVKSENLATVWLLYHLTDKLNMHEFRQLVQLVGLGRKKDESYQDYVERIRDQRGILVNRNALQEAAFDLSKREIESDLIFYGHEEAIENVRRLHFGFDEKKLDPKKRKASGVQRLNYQRLRAMNFQMKKRLMMIRELMGSYHETGEVSLEAKLLPALRFFYIHGREKEKFRIIYKDPDSDPAETWMNLTPRWLMDNPKTMVAESVWLDGVVPSEVLDLLQLHLKKNYRKLFNYKRYDLEVLAAVRDFRTLVNLLYVNMLAKQMGITTELEPVLSFPLGANSISIMEAARIYQSIMTGRVYPFNNVPPSSMTPLITKIIDREGEIVWEYERMSRKVIERHVSGSVAEILRLVVEKGTGKRARNAVLLSMETGDETLEVPIHAYGKTGTANRFTNSSFVGFIPGLKEKQEQLSLEEGFVIASYVGFDDNRPMKGPQTAIYGSSGALPIWIETANGIANSKLFKGGFDIANLAFEIQSIPLTNHEGLRPVIISTLDGLPLGRKETWGIDDHLQVLGNVEITQDALKMKREFNPLRGGGNEKGNDS
ncbi:transglycosylase domain-containing protein [Thermodesulfobacteriota bacterium]